MSEGWKHVHLRQFSKSELIFDEEETKAILEFFFSSEHKLIDQVTVTDSLRGFAQGLLVAAADATFAMGWVELTFKATAGANYRINKIIKKLTLYAASYWFKYLTRDQSLGNIKIYESVRREISLKFRSQLRIMILAKHNQYRAYLVTMINCGRPGWCGRLWG